MRVYCTVFGLNGRGNISITRERTILVVRRNVWFSDGFTRVRHLRSLNSLIRRPNVFYDDTVLQ